MKEIRSILPISLVVGLCYQVEILLQRDHGVTKLVSIFTA